MISHPAMGVHRVNMIPIEVVRHNCLIAVIVLLVNTTIIMGKHNAKIVQVAKPVIRVLNLVPRVRLDNIPVVVMHVKIARVVKELQVVPVHVLIARVENFHQLVHLPVSLVNQVHSMKVHGLVVKIVPLDTNQLLVKPVATIVPKVHIKQVRDRVIAMIVQ